MEVTSSLRLFTVLASASLSFILFVIFVVTSSAGTVFAESQLYVVRGKKGVVTFTSRKPAEASNYEVFVPKAVPNFSLVRSRYFRHGGRYRPTTKAQAKRYDPLIHRVSEQMALDPALVKAVVHVESGFQSHATSHKGAMGLMQLMPGTARRFGVRNAYHPEENVGGGAKYLRLLLNRYSGNVRLALAAYNAGEGAVDRYGSIPPYSETQEYVRRVLATIPLYRCGKSGKEQSNQVC